MTLPVIEINNVSKFYLRNKKSFFKYLFNNKKISKDFIYVLQKINLNIYKGECLGIIGTNGAGKSTLLKIIANVEKPSMGVIKVKGKVRSILELGASFDYSLTGRENIYLTGLLLGYVKKNIQKKCNEIIKFAGIENFIDKPLTIYSSGMVMRLAFAIQILTDPDILIIDEALSVGDFFFQQKCFEYINKLRRKKVTIIFVSHDMGIVRNLCSHVIHIENGIIIDRGSASSVVSNYFNKANIPKVSTEEKFLSDKKGYQSKSNRTLYAWESTDYFSKNYKSFGIKSLSLKSENDNIKIFINSKLKIEISVYMESIDDKLIIGISNKLNLLITSIEIDNCDLKPNNFPYLRRFVISTKLSLEAGLYSLKAVYTKKVDGKEKTIHSIDKIGPINITWDYDAKTPPFYGLVGLKHEIEKY